MTKHTKPRQHWTSAQERILLDHYADSTPQEMTALFNNEFDARQINDKAKRLGMRKSDTYKRKYGLDDCGRMQRGRTTWNKGLRRFKPPGSEKSQFKKGNVPKYHRAIGSTRISVDGYIEIKIEEGMYKWRLLHREIWKKHYGQDPPPGTAIIFKDGNKQNCDVDNLQLLTRRELMQRNTVHNLPEPLKEVLALKRSITRKINGK